jgi:hypothetical protein
MGKDAVSPFCKGITVGIQFFKINGNSFTEMITLSFTEDTDAKRCNLILKNNQQVQITFAPYFDEPALKQIEGYPDLTVSRIRFVVNGLPSGPDVYLRRWVLETQIS